MIDRNKKIMMRDKAIVITFFVICLAVLHIVGYESKPEPQPVFIKDVGTFIEYEEIPTTLNDAVKSKVKTSGGSFTVVGSISGFKGDKVVIKSIGGIWYLYIGENVEFWVLKDLNNVWIS